MGGGGGDEYTGKSGRLYNVHIFKFLEGLDAFDMQFCRT